MGRPTRRSTAIGDRRPERRYLQLHREHQWSGHFAGPALTRSFPSQPGRTSANYTVVYVNGTLTVGQATLTVTAGNASRAYGAANPAFTASATGAQNGDTFTFTESTTAVVFPPRRPGTYPIVPVATGANLGNYTVVYVNGTLTVGQATLTVTAGNASRAYGAANPAFTASAAGAQNSDTFSFTESTTCGRRLAGRHLPDRACG